MRGDGPPGTGSTRRRGPATALRSMAVWDARLQARYGFYAVYAVLAAVFALGLRAVDPAVRTDAAVLLVATDPTVLGFYFVAAMVLFEKRAGVLDALVVSPLGDRGYLASKVLTLSSLATGAATLVAVLGTGPSPRLALLIPGVAASAALFVLVGFVAVARFDSVNEYFIGAVGWGTVLFLPLAGYVGLVETPLFYLLPVRPVLVLVEAGFQPVSPWLLAYAFGYVLIGDVVAYRWARRSFRRHVVRGGDPGRQLGRESVPDRPRRALATRSPWTALVVTDLRNWVRDPLLAVAAVGPLALAVVVRLGWPLIVPLAAPALDLAPYRPVVAGAMTAFGPEIYGFVVGMFLLEDREQGVLTAFRTSPLSTRGYLVYRGATAYLLSLAATLPALVVLAPRAPPTLLVGAAAVGALGGPLVALAFGVFAANTIEGLALSKLVNLAVLVPALAVAVVPEPAQFLAGVLPAYWPVKAFAAGAAGGDWSGFLLVGVGVYAVAIAGLGRGSRSAPADGRASGAAPAAGPDATE